MLCFVTFIRPFIMLRILPSIMLAIMGSAKMG